MHRYGMCWCVQHPGYCTPKWCVHLRAMWTLNVTDHFRLDKVEQTILQWTLEGTVQITCDHFFFQTVWGTLTWDWVEGRGRDRLSKYSYLLGYCQRIKRVLVKGPRAGKGDVHGLPSSGSDSRGAHWRAGPGEGRPLGALAQPHTLHSLQIQCMILHMIISVWFELLYTLGVVQNFMNRTDAFLNGISNLLTG